ncbi:dipeptidase [Bacillus massilinigeriensis]|uniref:dipeptidase n=1 Tax=Bacillus mediterraneensis TaxID=1805474 RepID=UPI0008F8ECE7|nr:dipeptidase [Bacillus mediterraneensis]
MEIIDLHCDVLLKLQYGKGNIRFSNDARLDANKDRLKEGKVKIQAFAIFIDPKVKQEKKWDAALQQIELFHKEVLGKNSEMKLLKSWKDFSSLKEHDIGAFLTLEGVDPIGNDLAKLEQLHKNGVLSVGLTWNHANLAADGAGEPRGAGLTMFGKEIVNYNNRNRIFTDVSHLSDKAFWDVFETADYLIASHSNSRQLCNHQRNLTDSQASALFRKDGMLHIVFHPPFLCYSEKADIQDIIRHIDYFCSLGGVKNLGFGSDFDGISTHVAELENASKYQNLINELLKYFSEEEVRGFASRNFFEHLPR